MTPTGIIKRQTFLAFLLENGWYSSAHGLGKGVMYPKDHEARFNRKTWADDHVSRAENVCKVIVTWEVFKCGHSPDCEVYVRHDITYQEARLEPEIEARLEHLFRTYWDIPF